MEAIRNQANQPDVIIPRVGSQADHSASWLEYTINLLKGLLGLLQVLQDPGRNDEIKAPLPQRATDRRSLQ